MSDSKRDLFDLFMIDLSHAVALQRFGEFENCETKTLCIENANERAFKSFNKLIDKYTGDYWLQC